MREERSSSSRVHSSRRSCEKQAGERSSRVLLAVCASETSSSMGGRKLLTCESRAVGRDRSVLRGGGGTKAGCDQEGEDVETMEAMAV